MSSNRFLITVDYAKSLADMILAGKYDYVNENITVNNFPITGTGKVDEEIILVHLNRDISSDDAEAELAKLGLEPARIEHATALGEKYPDVQRECPIVFLGSVWTDSHGYPSVSYLHYWRDRRGLHLSYRHDAWFSRYRFAAIRKVLVPVL